MELLYIILGLNLAHLCYQYVHAMPKENGKGWQQRGHLVGRFHGVHAEEYLLL